MSQDERSEQDAIQRGLTEALSGSDGPRGARQGPSDGEDLERIYREIWGLLPYGLEPEAPSETTRRRLLAAIAQESSAGAAVTSPRSEPERIPDKGRGASWLTLAAAAVALFAIGLSGWLYLELQSREAAMTAIAGPVSEVSDLREQVAELGREMGQLRGRMQVMTSMAVKICPLNPAEGSPQERARGLIYFEEAQQKWFLAAEGLDPTTEGHVYQLWLLVNDTALDAGTFQVGPDGRAEMASSKLPEGLRAVAVTLESKGGSPAPTGPRILYGLEEEMFSPFEI